MYGSDTYSGENVSVESAQKLETVFTCLRVRAEAIGSLPLMIVKKTDLGRENVTNNPVTTLLKHRVNQFTTPYQFKRLTEHCVEAWGNCYWEIKRRAGMPEELIFMKPFDVQVTDYQGTYYYRHKGRVLDHMEVLHFRNATSDGILGVSTITQNRELLGFAKKQQKYVSRVMGLKPAGYLTTPNSSMTKDQEQADKLKKKFTDQISGDNVGGIPLLEGGVEFKPIGISPDDAQYIQTRDFTREDIYGIFRVPPTLAQNYQRATYSNAESQDLVFVKYTLLPVCINMEEELNYKLFPESNLTAELPMYVKFNVASLLRADFKSQTEGFRTLWNIGGIDDTQIAEFFDWDTTKTSGKRMVPMNMVPIEQQDAYIKSMVESGAKAQARDGLTIEELNRYKSTFGELK
jgi:HK97 family phage portal protein